MWQTELISSIIKKAAQYSRAYRALQGHWSADFKSIYYDNCSVSRTLNMLETSSIFIIYRYQITKTFSQMSTHYTFKSCTAIILAGGRSTRMGRDKRFLKIGKESIIEKQVRILKHHFPHVLISANDPDSLAHLEVDVIRDENFDKGPLEGLASALTFSPTNSNFVIAVDIPQIDIQLVQKMWNQNGHSIAVVPTHADGRLEPLFAFYDKACVPIFRGALNGGDNSIQSALERCSVYHFPMKDESLIHNLNKLQDYESYLQSSE
jgi:molybdopterin-guanine dinucleotide biosynthesis protein A